MGKKRGRKSEVVSVSLPSEIARELHRISKEQRRTKSSVVLDAILHYLNVPVQEGTFLVAPHQPVSHPTYQTKSEPKPIKGSKTLNPDDYWT